MQTVKIFDFETEQLSTIPLAELGHGMIQVNHALHGQVWVRADKTKQGTKYFHGPLTAEMREMIRTRIKEPLDEVYPNTLDEWEDGFRRDLYAEKEIATWITIAERFTAFVKANPLTGPQRKEAYDAMLHCTMVPNRQSFLETFKRSFLSVQQLAAAIAPFEINWRGSRKPGQWDEGQWGFGKSQ